MWKLLEARLRPDLPRLTGVIGVGLVVGLILAQGSAVSWDRPDRLGLMVGGSALLALWLGQRMIFVEERREKRLCLIAALPLPIRQVAWVRALAPVLFHCAVAVLVFVGSLVGRWSGGLAEERWVGWFLVLFGAILLLEQSQVLWDELRVRYEYWPFGWAVFFGVPTLVGGTAGATVGFLMGEDPDKGLDFLHWIEGALTAAPFIGGLFVATLLLLLFNRWLFVHRPTYVG